PQIGCSRNNGSSQKRGQEDQMGRRRSCSAIDFRSASESALTSGNYLLQGSINSSEIDRNKQQRQCIDPHCIRPFVTAPNKVSSVKEIIRRRSDRKPDV